MRYRTLADLKAAYESGELPRDAPLTLDSDCSYVYHDGEKVYEGAGCDLREEAFTLLGIPWEPC